MFWLRGAEQATSQPWATVLPSVQAQPLTRYPPQIKAEMTQY